MSRSGLDNLFFFFFTYSFTLTDINDFNSFHFIVIIASLAAYTALIKQRCYQTIAHCLDV